VSDLTIQGTKTALGPGLTASFGAQGGTPPYSYSLAPFVQGKQGAGGSIDSASGLYTAPSEVNKDPRNFYDTVIATDSSSPVLTAQTTILVGRPWNLLCEIFQKELGLPTNRVWTWNQKQDMPQDGKMFIILERPRSKPIGSGVMPVGTPVGPGGPGYNSTKIWSMVSATLDIHLYSRSNEADDRQAEVFAALTGPYCRSQQEANGFYLASVPQNSVDISGVDGTAIPYHFVISVIMMYKFEKVIAPPYFDDVPKPAEIFNR
jgi:hypothetical protein